MTQINELAIENAWETANQLRHLADNEIDSDSFAVVIENYNGIETEFERPITALALEAAGTIEALLAALEQSQQRVRELEARAFNPAILDVLAERQRQISSEGWTPEHDDQHNFGELAMAAICYINETGTVNRNGGKPWGWPWDASWWKPKTRRLNLVKAGALILAEIERLDRAAAGIKLNTEGEQIT